MSRFVNDPSLEGLINQGEEADHPNETVEGRKRCIAAEMQVIRGLRASNY